MQPAATLADRYRRIINLTVYTCVCDQAAKVRLAHTIVFSRVRVDTPVVKGRPLTC